jgi:hypothetical protein
MATVTRQQLAEQLNKLSAQGATEKQITNAIAAAGYTDSDFNIDLSGKFTPLTIGKGKVAGEDYVKPTAAEQADSNNFYNNLAAESSSTKPGSTTTNSITKTEIFSQSTGGGSTTVYSTPSTPTATSQAYQSQANQAYILAESYRLNPDSKFGKSALDKRLADGRITQDQYNEIVNSSAEQRRDKSLEYSSQYEQARTNQINSEIAGVPTVVVQPSLTTSQVSVTYEKATAASTTSLAGAVGGTNITSTTVNGTEYQVTPKGDGSATYTPVGSPDANAAKASTFTLEPSPTFNTPPATGIEPVTTFPIAQVPVQATPLTDPVQTPIPENTTPAPIQQYSNRPPQPAEEIPYTQRTIDQDPTATIQAQVAVEQQQKQIAINTAGLPVVAEDGTVAKGVNINPDTGQTYYTTPPNEISQNPSATGSSRGLQGAKRRTRAQATSQDAAYLSRLPDWRVKLQLAEGATYLYKSPTDAGILQPLQETEGVVFPYTPSIQVQYGAHYDPTDLTHSNYKIYQYKNSSVDNISITADFTAQDTYEARYLLAVIHFFRSVTKMFYGNDLNPRNGTPPPLCYLTGLGEFNFNQHPLAITNFTYTLPNDVDYIRANTEANSPPGVNQSAANSPNNTGNPVTDRTTSSGIQPGGKSLGPKFNIDPSKYKTGAKDPTYVPTKMQIQITAVPIMSRNVISNVFSLREYGSGKLLQGSKHAGVKGVW